MSKRPFFPRPGSMTVKQADALVLMIRNRGLEMTCKIHPFYSAQKIREFYERNSHMFEQDAAA